MKEKILAFIGIIGGTITTLLGGWDTLLIALIGVMVVDYITGFIVAAVFKKSTKTESGTLKSIVGWKGLARKGVTLLIVYVACQLDKVIGSDFVRDATIIAFTANELISIIENAGLMGVPIPSAITKAIDVLKNNEEEK